MTPKCLLDFRNRNSAFQAALIDNGVTKSNSATVNDAGASARRLI
jgi:hypothetical protein